ncbi:LPS-assembly protein LptD [bacterium]|nr:LPS-assembly protein LptD [candidate division CSSED10-310 bacterium]
MRNGALLFMLFCLCLAPAVGAAEGGLSSSGDSGGAKAFQDFQNFQNEQGLDENDLLQREFTDKNRRLTLLFDRPTPIFFSAEVQEYSESEHLFRLEGGVRIRKEGFRLEAERVTINDWTADIIANGDVVITFDKDRISCDKAVYNFETGLGIMYHCRGSMQPSVFFECSKLEKLTDYKRTGLAQYYMEDGTVTACEGPIPDWRIRSPKILARIENYMHLNHPSFWLAKVPVLYSPYWFYPIKTERSTGFLIPTVAYNHTHGIVLQNAFFLVLADNADATFGIDYYGRTGWHQSLEARYAMDAYSKGQMYIKHVGERAAPRQGRNAEERWTGTLYQIHQFPYNINATVNINYVGDQFFDADYGTEIEWLTNRNLYSYISATKSWTRERLTAEVDYTRDLDNNRRRDLQRLPRLLFNSGSQRIGRTPLRWDLNMSLESLIQEGYEEFESTLYEEDDPVGSLTVQDWLHQQVTRGNMEPELKLSFNSIPWFTFTPRFQYRFSWWSQRRAYNPDFQNGTWATLPEEGPEPDWDGPLRGTRRSGDGIFRQMYETGFDFEGPKFYRIFEFESKKIQKIKHLMYPALYYSYIPEVTQTEILYYDTLDEIFPANAVTCSLVNMILGKVATGEPTRATKQKSDMTSNAFDNILPEDDEEMQQPTTVREFARITLSQTYDQSKVGLFDEHEADYAAGNSSEGGVRNDKPYSDIRLETRIQPSADSTLSTNIYFDPYESKLSRADVNWNIYHRRGFMKFGWNVNRNQFDDPLDDVDILTLEGSLNVSAAFAMELSSYYDIERDFINHLTTKLTYISQCWAVSLHVLYRNKIVTGGYPEWELEDDYQIGISFRLKNVGDVGSVNLGDIWREE